VTDTSRSRLPELKDSSMSPIAALQTYLSNRQDLGELAEPMLAAAQLLMNDEAGQIRLSLAELADSPQDESVERSRVAVELEDSQQLRLL
jgi:DNA repair protein SbcD/Mre11